MLGCTWKPTTATAIESAAIAIKVAVLDVAMTCFPSIETSWRILRGTPGKSCLKSS